MIRMSTNSSMIALRRQRQLALPGPSPLAADPVDRPAAGLSSPAARGLAGWLAAFAAQASPTKALDGFDVGAG
jgi:hypothetical protein